MAPPPPPVRGVHPLEQPSPAKQPHIYTTAVRGEQKQLQIHSAVRRGVHHLPTRMPQRAAMVQFSDEEEDADASDEVRAHCANLGGTPPPAAPALA